MARYTNPTPQYLDNNGDPVPSGKLYFYKSGTISPLTTYKDENESIANTNPVLLDEAGRTGNIFFQGSAKVILTTNDDVQIWERDPVGGEKELGDFSKWDTLVSYDLNDIVEGSDGEFYKSLSNANQGNDPTTSPEEWENIRFIGVWNTNITYSSGDVVQTSTGNLWKSLISQDGNDPELDDGTNWTVAINEQWVNKSSAFTVFAGIKYQIDGSISSVDAPLKTSYSIGDEIVVGNESISTNTVRLTNSALTIKGAGDTLSPGDNLVLEPGDTVTLVAKTSTILEVR